VPSEDKLRQPKKRANQAKFLAAMVETGGNILRAAAAAGISRAQHYVWLEEDPGYKERFVAAWDQAIDTLEAEAARRAYEGVPEPVFRNGERALDLVVDDSGQIQRDGAGEPITVPASIRKYSDTLLIFLLNGNRPSKYRQRADVLVGDSARPLVKVIVEYEDREIAPPPAPSGAEEDSH
jgi:hypothetical protein